jgi:hypothetical protein
MSPRLIPIRNRTRSSSGKSGSQSTIALWTCIHNTREFREQTVAGVFNDAPPMLLDFTLDQFSEMRLQPSRHALGEPPALSI